MEFAQVTKAEAEILISKSNYWTELANREGSYEVQVAELADAFKMLGAERMLNILGEYAVEALNQHYRVVPEAMIGQDKSFVAPVIAQGGASLN